MADAFQVTVLESLDGALTKSVTRKDGSYRTEPVEAGLLFLRRVSPVISTALELSNFVRELEQSVRCCVVTGAPSSSFPLDQPVRRLKHDRPGHVASLIEQTSAFHPIDLDGLDVPGADVLRDPTNAAKAAARFLGVGFDMAKFHYQFTASQRPDSTNLRLRLYFITEQPHTNEERTRWAKALIERGIPVDSGIYQAAQPIYTAIPEFLGCIDPLPCRSGYVEGETDRVHLVIPERTVRTVAPFVSMEPPSHEVARVRHVLRIGVAMARTFEKHGG